jgi:hypothetical protein
MQRGCLTEFTSKTVVAWNAMIDGLKKMQDADHLNQLDQLRLEGVLLFGTF